VVDQVAAVVILQEYLDERPPAAACQGRSLARLRKLVLVLLLAAVAYGAWFHETQWPVRGAGDPPQPLVVAQGAGVPRHRPPAPAARPGAAPGGLPLLRAQPGATGRLRAGEYALERLDEPRADRGQARARRRRPPHRHLPGGHEPRGHGAPGRGQGHPGGAFLAAARNPRARSGPRSGRQGPRGLSLSRHLRHPARPRAGGPARGAHGPALPHGDGAELPGCPAAARCARS
jgi:hypothetical protein